MMPRCVSFWMRGGGTKGSRATGPAPNSMVTRRKLAMTTSIVCVRRGPGEGGWSGWRWDGGGAIDREVVEPGPPSPPDQHSLGWNRGGLTLARRLLGLQPAGVGPPAACQPRRQRGRDLARTQGRPLRYAR